MASRSTLVLVRRAREGDPAARSELVERYYHRAYRLSLAGKEAEARLHRERARASGGEGWAREWFQAQEAERNFDWKGARECYGRLTESGKEPFRGFRYQAHLRRAQAAMYQGDFEEANLDLARAEGAWEARPEAEVVRAIVLRRQGRKEQSDEVIRRLLERERWSREVLLKVLYAFGEEVLDDSAKLLELVEKGLEFHPRDADLLSLRTEAFIKSSNPAWGRLQDPVTAAVKLNRMDPESIRLRVALGNAYFAEGEYESAVEVLRDLAEEHPREPLAWLKLGEALWRLGHQDRAREAFDRSLAAGPTGAGQLALAGWLTRQGDFSAAERLLEQGLRSDPTLHFAELVEFRKDPGKRVFEVRIGGKALLESFDIAREAGFRAPLTRTAEVDVPDGLLEIDLRGLQDGPMLNAIEAVPAGER